jgi:hypothetical protein
MVSNVALLSAIICAACFSDGASASFQEGDKCGVNSQDFFKVGFGGDYRVAGGEGCDLGFGHADCFCGVDYDDSDRLSEWKWQCNGAVEFGPATGKQCPDSIPVPLNTTTVSWNNETEFMVDPVECDPLIHPTGQRGDPVCGYSDCDIGGDSSAICGCVNLTQYGIGEGTQWFCMHSTCSCTNMTEAASNNSTTDEGPDGAEIVAGNSTDEVVFKEGGSCGITSSDFFKPSFGGDYRVAGSEGCTLEDGQENCLCAVDYDGDALSPWKWQCNNSVVFGPATGKVCPASVPLPVGTNDVVECDITVNPTGQSGDQPCAYSDCETGGDSTSICACINTTAYGLGDGIQWFCLHSSCSCSAAEAANATDSDLSMGEQIVEGSDNATNALNVHEELGICGITNDEFFDPMFAGDYPVAGSVGCDLGEGQERCLCAVDDDGDNLSPWKWQCNESVEFGPIAGKVCPSTIPVPAGFASLDGEQALAVNDPVECDVSIHPNGYRGDPPCGYSDCEGGGNSTAICACVDMAVYGLGEGVQWFCLHSSCSCPGGVTESTPTGATPTDDGAATTNVTSTKESSAFVATTFVSLMAATLMAILLN